MGQNLVRKPLRGSCRIGLLALALICFSLAAPSRAPLAISGASAQTASAAASPGSWFTDLPAKALAISGDTLYIGGDFTKIGVGVGGVAAFNSASQYDPSFPPAGAGAAITADGAGGWYLSASKRLPGAPPSILLHLRADGTFEQGWRPNRAGGPKLIALDSQHVYVYASSDYTYKLQAFDRATGGAPLWSAEIESVSTIVVSGGVVYVGGRFTQVRSPAAVRKYAAAFDGTTGALKPWNPNPNSFVETLEAGAGIVYLGGDFTDINGTPRSRLAAVDPVTALPVAAWDPAFDSVVQALLVRNDTLYVGGRFRHINGEARSYLAALTAASGALTPWSPEPNSEVRALTAEGGRLYAGGEFTASAVSSSAYIAAFDLATGAALPFEARLNSGVNTLFASGGVILAKGYFQSFTPVECQYIAAVDRATGLIKDWAPAIDGQVNELLVQGNTLYIAGNFTTVAGAPRLRAAAFDIPSGALTAWDPQPNDDIVTLAAGGGVIYAGGVFTEVNSPAVPRRYLAAFDAATGAVTSWDPNPDAIVFSLGVTNTLVYAAGEFQNVGSPAVNRNRLAAFNRATGELTPWGAPPAGAMASRSLSPGSAYFSNPPLMIDGNRVYGTGLALDATTGAILPWQATTLDDREVGIRAVDGDRLYAVGTNHFNKDFVDYYLLGVDRYSGKQVTCSIGSEHAIVEVIGRDGLAYFIYRPRNPYTPNFISVAAVRLDTCVQWTYLPIIRH